MTEHGARHDDVSMRTELTLDPDVARLVNEAVHQERRPMKQVINDALRQALAPKVSPRHRHPYQVVPHHGAAPGS